MVAVSNVRCPRVQDVSKLLAAVPDYPLLSAKESIVKVFQRMRDNLAAAGSLPPPPAKDGPKPPDAM